MVYELIRSKRKTLAVHIDYTGKIIIKAPLNLSIEKINAFLINKSDWIIKNQSRIQGLYELYKNLFDYSELMYKGKIFKIVYDDIKSISINDNQDLAPKKYRPLNKQKSLINALKKLLIIEAEKEFNQLLNKYKEFGFKYNNLKIINSKTRWGICDSKGNISLNFRAIMLPGNLLNYLIIHELAHTIQLNHSKKFWNIIQNFIPEYKALRKELKSYNFLQELFR
ncbi:MAG TPA: SprT family zinc-dependent metalloprotease [Clostridia bacterium]